jgi:hypothetical protein
MKVEQRIWKDITGQNGEESRERRRNFFSLFEIGGAEKEELSRHLGQVCDVLCRARHYDTLAVLLWGLGLDDNRIVARRSQGASG